MSVEDYVYQDKENIGNRVERRGRKFKGVAKQVHPDKSMIRAMIKDKLHGK